MDHLDLVLHVVIEEHLVLQVLVFQHVIVKSVIIIEHIIEPVTLDLGHFLVFTTGSFQGAMLLEEGVQVFLDFLGVIFGFVLSIGRLLFEAFCVS